MLEWALGFDLQEHFEQNEDMRTARGLVIKHWIFVNDIFSFPKELEAGEKVNSVWILMGQGLSLQSTLDRLAAITVETEAQFIATRDRILDGPLGDNPEIVAFLLEMGYAISGNLRFHRKTCRYHGFTRKLPDSDAGTLTPEPTIVYHRETVNVHVVTVSM
ncbi:terpene synthase metal binding domain protein [Penicillium malachiteum]|uniref:terpene synthase metal binding domain protein n=1 Tax=Penicillium malachiteum TaxID=1324776 RepID=UPI002547EBBE|nr:terpene synthase metal binding domain protein [Penicillium malachiteum]KAJ5726017.1 terpene synthase metal binding domain protein [Penicillium malachiteum]